MQLIANINYFLILFPSELVQNSNCWGFSCPRKNWLSNQEDLISYTLLYLSLALEEDDQGQLYWVNYICTNQALYRNSRIRKKKKKIWNSGILRLSFGIKKSHGRQTKILCQCHVEVEDPGVVNFFVDIMLRNIKNTTFNIVGIIKQNICKIIQTEVQS